MEIPVFIKNITPNHLDKLIVILKDNNGLFHINRYFPVYTESNVLFEISADLERGTAEQVFITLNKLFPEGVKTNII